jgi:hypothetical protein
MALENSESLPKSPEFDSLLESRSRLLLLLPLVSKTIDEEFVFDLKENAYRIERIQAKTMNQNKPYKKHLKSMLFLKKL